MGTLFERCIKSLVSLFFTRPNILLRLSQSNKLQWFFAIVVVMSSSPALPHVMRLILNTGTKYNELKSIRLTLARTSTEVFRNATTLTPWVSSFGNHQCSPIPWNRFAISMICTAALPSIITALSLETICWLSLLLLPFLSSFTLPTDFNSSTLCV